MRNANQSATHLKIDEIAICHSAHHGPVLRRTERVGLEAEKRLSALYDASRTSSAMELWRELHSPGSPSLPLPPNPALLPPAQTAPPPEPPQ
jgi:hypothetical protein